MHSFWYNVTHPHRYRCALLLSLFFYCPFVNRIHELYYEVCYVYVSATGHIIDYKIQTHLNNNYTVHAARLNDC